MIRLTRQYGFSASHRLHSPLLSEPENDRVYGKCNNPYGHGHNYLLEVSVRGPVEERTGRAVDLPVLDRLVREQVIEAFDHRNLNEEFEVFRAVVATTENLALEIRRRLLVAWPAAFAGEWPRLDRIRVRETDRNTFEIQETHES